MSSTILEPRQQTRDTLLSRIGNTPLLRLPSIGRDLPPGVELFAKAEHFNPGGSVKDRPALNMILSGERSGKLRAGMTILDATSGNTGIAYGIIGAALGYRVTICLPSNASGQRKQLLRQLGVELFETDPLSSTDGAQLAARELYELNREKYFYPDQYNNPANWLAHYETTAAEIWEQTAGRITHFITGLGTTGTFVGCVRRLREFNANLHAISIQPDSPLHGLEGLKHMPTAFVPGIYDPMVADENWEVRTEDALETRRRLAREEGIVVGPSSGANVFGALRLAETLPAGSVVVTVLCDRGERYSE